MSANGMKQPPALIRARLGLAADLPHKARPEGPEQASAPEVHAQKRQPHTEIAKGPQRQVRRDIAERGKHAGGAQGAALYGSYENPVELKRRHTQKRHQRAEGQKGERGGLRLRVEDKGPDHRAAADKEDHRDHSARDERQLRCHPHGTFQPGRIPRAYRLAGLFLGDEGKPVEHEGRNGHELQEHFIAGERGGALSCPGIHEPGKAEQQGERADHDVAIGGEQADKLAARDQAGMAGKGAPDEDQPEGKGGPFGYGGAGAYAGRAPVERGDEIEVEHDIDAVHHDLKGKEFAGPPCAEEPAGYAIAHQQRRRAPDAGVEIVPAEGFHVCLCGEGSKRYGFQGRAEEEQDHAKPPAEHQRAQEHSAHFRYVARAGGLRRQPGRRHAQKAEPPIDKAERNRRHGYCGKVRLVAEPAHSGGVDNAGHGNRRL